MDEPRYKKEQKQQRSTDLAASHDLTNHLYLIDCDVLADWIMSQTVFCQAFLEWGYLKPHDGTIMEKSSAPFSPGGDNLKLYFDQK